MSKLSKPKSFSVSNEIIEVDFQGTTCQCANLLKSGITNQTIVLIDYGGKWHEINVLDHGGDDSNLQAFANFIETMNLGLVDLGIISEKVKTDYSLKHQDFMELSEKFPPHDYIQISKLNDYNVKQGLKDSVYELKSWLQVCQRDKISIDELIQNREIEKQEIINEEKSKNIMKAGQVIPGEYAPEVPEVPVESIEVVDVEVVNNSPAEFIEVKTGLSGEQKTSALVAEFNLPKTPAKKPISLQVFETLTPERISELQGLNERQLQIVKENPVVKTITDKTSYELAKKTAAVLLKASTAIDGKEGIQTLGMKYLNNFKDLFKKSTDPIIRITRDPYDEQKTIISSWENSELLREQAEQRAKLAKIKKRTDELFAVPFTFNGTIYSIGTVYCTPSQVETATDEDFAVIVENGKTIKQALDAEALKNDAKDKEIEDLKAKLAALTGLAEMSNTEPETVVVHKPSGNGPTQTVPVELKSSPANQVSNFMNPNVTEKPAVTVPTNTTIPAYVLPSIENTLLNALDLKNAEHLEKPAYIKCRGYYVQGLIDVAKEIEFILNDAVPNPVKKSERISNLCTILKNSK